MATSGDFYLATSGDFFMATDTRPSTIRTKPCMIETGVMTAAVTIAWSTVAAPGGLHRGEVAERRDAGIPVGDVKQVMIVVSIARLDRARCVSSNRLVT